LHHFSIDWPRVSLKIFMLNKITVLISDDHSIVRSALGVLLEATEDIIVVGEATNGQQAVEEVKRLRPTVALLDLGMPLLNGIEAARRIVSQVPSTKVLVLSGYSDDQHVLHAVQAGITGYLVKQSTSADLLRAVREVAQGHAFISPCIYQRLLTNWPAMVNYDEAYAPGNPLTSRQAEVLQLVAEGYMSKEIAPILSLSIKTVEKHRQSLMEKLHLHKIADLTRYAISSGRVEANYVPRMAA